MAHVTKIKRGGAYNSLAHDDRSQENISNKEVDRERSYMNIALHNGDTWENYKNIIENKEVRCHNRSDVNTLVSWVVTSPLKEGEVADECINNFFELCHDFMTERYGVELDDGSSNVVSSVVHFDETSPHLHFKFVPLVADLKKGGYKVNAKKVVDRADLQTFHKDLQNYLEERGCWFRVVDDVTVDKDYSKSIADLKKETKELERKKRSEIALLDGEIASKTAQIEKMGISLSETVQRLESAQIDAEIAESKLGKLQAEVERLEEYIPVLENGLKASAELRRLKGEVEGLCDMLKAEMPRTAVRKVEEKRVSLESRIQKAVSATAQNRLLPKQKKPKDRYDR